MGCWNRSFHSFSCILENGRRAVVSGLVAVNLVMYTLGFMQENTMINEFIKSNESLTDTFNLWFTDTRGVMMWFSLWFFLNFAVVAAGRRGGLDQLLIVENLD